MAVAGGRARDPAAHRPEEVTDRLGRDLADDGEPARRGDRAPRRRRRNRAHRHGVAALLRLGDRRHAAGRARRRLAGQRLGPEHRAARGHAGRRRRRGARAASGCSTCSACPRQPTSGSSTGATMAQLHGWPPARERGAAPRRLGRRDRAGSRRARAIRVLVGAERHGTVDLAAALPRPRGADPVAADEQGRIRVDALAAALAAGDRARRSCCLQAGNIHSGAFDDFARGDRARPRARRVGARRRRVRAVGGRVARGCGTSRRHRGRRLMGDRRAQDAQRAVRLRHRDRRATPPRCTRALGMRASYLQRHRGGADPLEQGARALAPRPRRPDLGGAALARPRPASPSWSTGSPRAARGIADGVAALPGVEVLNDVVFTQVCVALGRRRATGRSASGSGATARCSR